jgi:hypothetical protein
MAQKTFRDFLGIRYTYDSADPVHRRWVAFAWVLAALLIGAAVAVQIWR